MDVSICILTHSQPLLLPRCVASCIREIERAGLNAEIIIVDNASSDRYPEAMAAAMPVVRVVRSEKNMGFAVASNMAVRLSRGEDLLLLNDDAILQEGSLQLMIAALKSDPGVAAVGPMLVFPDGSPQVLYMNKRLPHLRGMVLEFTGRDLRWRHKRWVREWLTMWGSPENADEPEQLSGCCLLIRRRAWNEMGGFDEQFYYVLDDTDLCYRLRKAGWRFRCVRTARVTHYGGSTFVRWDRLEQQFNYYRCVYAYFRKHKGILTYLAMRTVLEIAVLFVFAESTLHETVNLIRSRRRVGVNELIRKARGKLALLWCVLRVGAAPGGPPQPSRD